MNQLNISELLIPQIEIFIEYFKKSDFFIVIEKKLGAFQVSSAECSFAHLDTIQASLNSSLLTRINQTAMSCEL